MVLFGTLYCMHIEGGWQRYNQNLSTIKPYCNGPPLYQYFSDCVVAVGGMVHRRGLVEFTSSFALMFIFNPWIKYWITGNIWTSDLKERFVTQVGSSLGARYPHRHKHPRVRVRATEIELAQCPLGALRHFSPLCCRCGQH